MEALLRPAQVEEMQEERARLIKSLDSPLVTDKGGVARSIRRLDHQLETQTPKPFRADEKDSAIRRERQLLAEMTGPDCPTQAEMRRNPPGAVDKLRRWEARYKKRLLEWKALRLRNHVSGDVAIPDERDVANFERFRPRGGSGEMNLDGAQIEGADVHIPDEFPIKNLMSEEERTRLEDENLAFMKKKAEEGDPRYVRAVAALEAGEAEEAAEREDRVGADAAPVPKKRGRPRLKLPKATTAEAQESDEAA